MRRPPPDEILELAHEQIAARHAAERATAEVAAAWRDRRWGVAFLLLLFALLLAFVLWPGATLEWKLYATVGIAHNRALLMEDLAQTVVYAFPREIYAGQWSVWA